MIAKAYNGECWERLPDDTKKLLARVGSDDHHDVCEWIDKVTALHADKPLALTITDREGNVIADVEREPSLAGMN